MYVPSEQAGVLEALPKVDLETAQDLQRCQQTNAESSLREPAAHEAFSSIIDVTEDSTSSDVPSSKEEKSKKQNILLRRPKEVPAAPDDGAGPSDWPGVWDSYDAEEEALLMQGPSLTALNPGSLHGASGKQSNESFRADRTNGEDSHPGSSNGAPSMTAGMEKSYGGSPAVSYVKEVVPFPERNGLQDIRRVNPVEHRAIVNRSERTDSSGDSRGASVSGQSDESRLTVSAADSRRRSRLESGSGRGVPSFASSRVLSQVSESAASAVEDTTPRLRRGPSTKGIEPVLLPEGLKAKESRGHPWMRCRTFALAPIPGRDKCSIFDASGNM